MKKHTYRTKTKVWLYQGPAAWHFATIPKELSSKIKKKHGTSARGWGSLPIEATVGETTWSSSIFPDSKSGTYLLPLKANVRKKEEIFEGDTIELTFRVKT